MKPIADSLFKTARCELEKTQVYSRSLKGLRIACLGLVFAITGVSSVFSPVSGQESLKQADVEFRAKHQAVIKKFCAECHFGSTAKAGVNLEMDQGVQQILAHQKLWESVHRVLDESEMPPGDSPQPSEEERASLTQWLDHVLHTLRCSVPINPGSATLRRLNRTEYRNTIRDFVGVDYLPADEFPGDDVGYGFDNIGDVLALPPILLEKYLAAAEQISQQAIVDTATLRTDRSFKGSDLDACKGAYAGANMMVVAENGTVSTVTSVTAAGRYRLVASVSGHQAGDDPVRLELIVNGKSIGDFEVSAQFPKVESKSAEIELPPGELTLGVAFLNDFLDRDDKRATGNDRNLVVESVRIVGPTELAADALPLSHRRLMTVLPDEATSQVGAARKMIPQWLSQAYRRPPTDAEASRLVGLFEMAQSQGSNFEGSMRLVLQAILVSPQFLYKIEKPLPADGSSRSLDDFELATALSYFLWSTMPDTELFAMAGEGRLSDPAIFRAQIKRMLRDPKAANLIDNFAVQWLQLQKLQQASPNPEKFPEFDDSLRADMLRETKLFLGRIFEENESILRLLDERYSFVNERLAKHYGLPGVTGNEFRREDVSVLKRGGILTQASILTLSSYPARTSPVKRGKWIMENLLGQSPPPPDPAAMPLDEQTELVGSLRQRMEQHRRDPNCASCHERMDPLGFALENFDAIGRWRDQEGGEPIDSSASFPDGTKFNGAGELQQMLTNTELQGFLRCFVEKLMTFALGRGLEYEDQCAIDAIVQATAQDEYRVHAIIMAVAESEPFRKRQNRGVE